MNPYFVIADIGSALSLLGVAALARYRIAKQGEADPALKHLKPVMYMTLLGAVGGLTRDTYPPMALLSAIGDIGVVLALGTHIKAMIHQPTLTDVRVVASRIAEVEAKVAAKVAEQAPGNGSMPEDG
jgi:hypothetical protein